jgi:predicted nuclease of predicted toxin-antitoxin system
VRFLADENFPFDAVEALRQADHDVAWIRTDAPGIGDPEVLRRAQTEARILLTFDKDFGELVIRSQLPASVGIILFRMPMTSGATIAQQVLAVISSRDDWAGHFSVVEADRLRMRRL